MKRCSSSWREMCQAPDLAMVPGWDIKIHAGKLTWNLKRGHLLYMDPKGMQNNGLFGPLERLWATVLHTFGVQVERAVLRRPTLFFRLDVTAA